MLATISRSCALLMILTCGASYAILNEGDNRTSSATSDANLKQANNISESNTTFYYEANAFLINKDESAPSNKSKPQAAAVHPSVRPASVASTSARNGRMMDLDSLVGDFAASRANKERYQTGNRQSRFLPGMPNLDIGSGKKLHIQGFIPIVGVKDATDDEESSELEQSTTKHKPRAQTQPVNEMPYGQSSLGHASFGVHRYLNSEGQQPQQSQYQQQLPVLAQGINQQTEAKYSSASVVDTIKKPIKKLANYVGYEAQPTQQASNQQQQQQNCLCVPFYMCKYGYINESSLSKSQLQQLISQQQQQQQQAQPTRQVDQIEMKPGQLISAPQRSIGEISQPSNEPQSQAQYADSYAAIDERSFDRELVTMSSLSSGSGSFSEVSNQPANQTTDSASSSEQQQQSQPEHQLSVSEEIPSNVTEANQQLSSDYSQDILGRMLGLKSSTSRQSAVGTGVCGLLRTCCAIVSNLSPTQQERIAQYASQLAATSKPQSQPLQRGSVYQSSQNDLVPMRQQQVSAVQRYQPLVPMPTKIPYGLPAQAPRAQLMQQIGAYNPIENSLAHRSTQFQQQSTRYPYQSQLPQPTQLAQFTRSLPQAQSMQIFQQQQPLQQQQQQSFQQQPKSMPMPLGSLSLAQQMQSSANAIKVAPQTAAINSGLGTRKLLEGRCGLRQAAGITGRVQNLQYHESSAEFGEYPAQAAILKRLPGSDSLFVCGGTLISQYWVATAAHCIKKHAQGDLKVRLGEWDVHRDDEFYQYVEKEVRDLVVHPDFVAGNLVNDIALLRLDSPVDASLPHVNPACLPTIDESFASQRCWVTGWGKDSFGQKGSFQAVLREVELPVVSNSECEAALRQTRLGPHYRLHTGFICAGGEGGRDACEGDGGSGLYCIQEGVIKVAGLVSWGIGCGQAGVPGVYVNLAHYRAWIENIISIDEDIYSPYSSMIGNSIISERSNSNVTASETSDPTSANTTVVTTIL